MQNQSKYRLLSGALLFVGLVLFIIANISAGYFFKGLRFDLTQDRIYTLSQGSKAIIAKIDEPIILRLYFSKSLAKVNPYLISFATRVQDLLVQYERASHGKIVLEVIDPLPGSLDENDAQGYGLQAIPLDDLGSDLYFGLVATNAANLKRVITFIQPARESTLEYDVSQMLTNLNAAQLPKAAVISSLPIDGRGTRPWMIWQQMNSQFDLQILDPDVAEIPSGIKVLMLVNPENFKNEALLAIDEFVMQGGHVIAYVDPYSEATDSETAALNAMHRDPNADFSRLLNSWGVELEPQKVVADRSLAKQVQIDVGSRQQMVRYPLWLDLTAANFAADDVVTAGIDRMTLGTPGSLRQSANSTITFKPLITSSPDAMLVPVTQVPQYQENLSGMMQTYAPTGSYVLAARISGAIKSPYTDKHSVASNIIVVADADLLHDHFWVSFQNIMGQEFGIPTAANGSFVMSALDNLNGSNDLISIRNKGNFVRPFTALQQYEAALQTENAEERLQANQKLQTLQAIFKFLGIGFMPLLIVIFGLGFWIVQLRRELRLVRK